MFPLSSVRTNSVEKKFYIRSAHLEIPEFEVAYCYEGGWEVYKANDCQYLDRLSVPCALLLTVCQH